MDTRLDRQLRIDGWDQQSLDDARISVVGNGTLASYYVMSAAALGLDRITLIGSGIDDRLLDVAACINPGLELDVIEGYYTSARLDSLIGSSDCIINGSDYALAGKLLINLAYKKDIPLVTCSSDQDGFRLFSYMKGREWSEMREVLPSRQLPGEISGDPVLDSIVAGIALEETKSILMGHDVSEDLISCERTLGMQSDQPRILIVGAGALGNFVGLGLGFSEYRNITLMDPDTVDETNLNRQVLFYDRVGEHKAATLGERINKMFIVDPIPLVQYFKKDTDLSGYDVVFDCLDNFESRVVLSDRCKEEGKILISGGTNVDAGQMIVYDPRHDTETPADFLGLHELVEDDKEYERDTSSCTYRPDPSVIMTNQIIAGFMVDAFRQIVGGGEPRNIFYDSDEDKKF